MKQFSKSAFEAIKGWPTWQRSLFGLLLCPFATYFSITILLVALGQPAETLYDPIRLVVTVEVLLVTGGIGLLVRRPDVVGEVFTAIGVVLLLRALGPDAIPLEWIRVGIAYMMPLVNGILLDRWQLSMCRGKARV